MKIKPVNLFHTPSDMDELMEMIERLSGPERAIATQFAMYAWNLAAKTTNEETACKEY